MLSQADQAVPTGAVLRLAVVVGGARGLGSAIADHLRFRSEVVVTTARTVQPTATGQVACDIDDEASVEGMAAHVVDTWGVPDTVVIVPGIGHRNLATRLRTDVLDAVFRTNLRGHVLVARAFLPHLLRQRRGSLVFISSASGAFGTEGLAAYAASKAGLVGLCRTIARETASRGVRANVVAPGLLENAEDLAPQVDRWLARTAARRVGTLTECAAVVSFLSSPVSRGITGAVVPVDGGFGLGWS